MIRNEWESNKDLSLEHDFLRLLYARTVSKQEDPRRNDRTIYGPTWEISDCPDELLNDNSNNMHYIAHSYSWNTISSSLFARWQCCYSVFSTVIQTSIIGLTRHRRNGRELKFKSVRVTLNLPENGDEFTSATEIFPASLKFLYASVWT